MTQQHLSVEKIARFWAGWGWLAILLLAAALRFWQLGEWPPGLYRDEAFNGLDALSGRYPVFYPANNGREAAYIYLTAVSVALFGPTTLALRLPAALIGSLTTIPVYYLGRDWFGPRVGWLAALLWAITLWPVHLSHIGLRLILLPLCLSLTFWLLSRAYRQQRPSLWLLAGFVYGLGFYTYLAIRFTPVLLLMMGLYLLWQRRARPLWPGILYFGIATAVTLLPLALFYAQNPDLLIGRTGQVSILSPSINHGDLWGTLWRHLGRSLGLFIWQGDSIVRHNPATRPLFDLLMAGPFLLGLGLCLWRWRRPSAALTLLWIGCMLAVTILAEDAPHFLRSVGILPAVLFLPAVGLDALWRWPKLPTAVRQGMVCLLLLGSLLITVRDYAAYGRDPETALMFEAAASQLAAQLNAETDDTAVYLDRWFWDENSQKGWPSIPFLANLERVTLYRPEFGVPPAPANQPISVYAWPYGDINFIPGLMPPPALISVQSGPLSRGDLEPEPYPLYSRYHAQPLPQTWPLQLNFAEQLWLYQASATAVDRQTVEVSLFWGGNTAVDPHLRVFVQLVGPDGVVAQLDLPPGAGLWQADWWQPGLVLQEQHQLALPRPFDPGQQTLIVGLYNSQTGQRLPITAADGQSLGDHWPVPVAVP